MQINRTKKSLFAFAAMTLLLTGALQPSFALFDKTRFVAHLGVAYFCFHHWVSKPFKEGKFTSSAPHRTATIVKAGGALLFAVHEVKVSNDIAHKSKDPLLQKLAGSLDNMSNSFSSLGQKFKSGKFNNSDMDSLNSAYGGVDKAANNAKLNVRDVQVAIPGN